MYIRANDSRADRRGTDDTPYEGLVYTANNRDREKQPHLQYRQLSAKSNRPDRHKKELRGIQSLTERPQGQLKSTITRRSLESRFGTEVRSETTKASSNGSASNGPATRPRWSSLVRYASTAAGKFNAPRWLRKAKTGTASPQYPRGQLNSKKSKMILSG